MSCLALVFQSKSWWLGAGPVAYKAGAAPLDPAPCWLSRESSEGGPSPWTMTTHVGDPKEALGCWLWPDPVVAVTFK